ncbi:MAG: hypothetical protein ACLGI6_22990 [Gammaproteobacteria bacterium]
MGVKRIALQLALWLACTCTCGWAASVHAAPSTPLQLSCENASDEAEKKRIAASAADVVRRISATRLVIKAGGKTLALVDKGDPQRFDGEGDFYRYCERKDGFILIRHVDGHLDSGKLINEATGDIVPGGARVLFSQDRRAYLAIFEKDGSEGSHWRVYAADGRLSWDGYDYLHPPGNLGWVLAYMVQPSWDERGRLSAEARCESDPKRAWKVTLVKVGATWDWRPAPKCPKFASEKE